MHAVFRGQKARDCLIASSIRLPCTSDRLILATLVISRILMILSDPAGIIRVARECMNFKYTSYLNACRGIFTV